MDIKLNNLQKERQKAFRAFVDEEVIQNAGQYDSEERIPVELIEKLAQQGYLGAILPGKYGGLGMDFISYGLLNEELGRGCASVRGLVMMQNMIGLTILKWGSDEQKARWLGRIAAGKTITAFALTEPDVGSDAMNINTSLTEEAEVNFIISGHKKWITLGQIADLFLVFGKKQGKICAVLLEKDSPGLSVVPIAGMLGARASMLAELRLDKCSVPRESLVGRAGFGFVPVGLTALNLGRYSIAWGCVGIGQACLEACLEYTSTRKQFGKPLKKHQLIQKMITEMVVNIKAARLLCCRAGQLQDEGDANATIEIMTAKYFASKASFQAASDAVQIYGAIGCSTESAVGRHFRDAKIMEIIEGTSQIHEIMIAKSAYRL